MRTIYNLSLKNIFIAFFLFTYSFYAYSQNEYTHADSLRGSNSLQRSWWDVQYYDLHVLVNPRDSTIIGSNTITYLVKNSNQIMQIDLQAPMHIDKVMQNGKEISFTSDGNTHYLKLLEVQSKGAVNKIKLYFSGRPHIAIHPPWDGGIMWTKDSLGNLWVANANEGIGASVWWPLKDLPSDEPDNGMTIAVTAPKHLMDVSNGRLIKIITHKNTNTWIWKVVSPINPYGVNISIGNYTFWKDEYDGEKGKLDLSYYVLKNHKKQAERQFTQVKKMLKAFEYWFGPYPFYEDGYKLVEVPYLGMEHQSCVAYGNHFQNGYLGRDLSGTGWGLKFDFIIIHESGHEWFANNITASDAADMWIQEGFTCYSEALFLEYYYGKKAASEYIIGLRNLINNDKAMIGNYGVNDQVTEDIYWKGANILNTLRQWVNNDSIWRATLRGINKTFYHQTIASQQLENYISHKLNLKLSPFWNQYLRTTNIPTLEYRITGNDLKYRYINVLDDFRMPIDVAINSIQRRIYPSERWQKISLTSPIKEFKVDGNYYVNVKKRTELK